MNVHFKLVLFLTLILGVSIPHHTMAQDNTVVNYIQRKSDIKEGGTGLYKFQKDTYLITVTFLAVGSKSELNCKTVGSSKAKRDMLAYINGSDISSYTELITSEETLESKSVNIEQKFVESIKETVLGTINDVKPLGGWYSDDQSVYYYAIYKTVQ